MIENRKKESKNTLFTEAEVAGMFEKLVLALIYLHDDKKICHRDLKPHNILLAEPNDCTSIKLMDFGLATEFDGEYMDENCGSANWVAPEVISCRYKGGTCDIWSLGVILYGLLCGELPFKGDGGSRKDLFGKIKKREFACPAGEAPFSFGLWAGVTEKAKGFVKKLLTLDPNHRPNAKECLKLAKDMTYFHPTDRAFCGIL